MTVLTFNNVACEDGKASVLGGHSAEHRMYKGRGCIAAQMPKGTSRCNDRTCMISVIPTANWLRAICIRTRLLKSIRPTLLD